MSGILWSKASELRGLRLPRKAVVLVALETGYQLVPYHTIKVEADGTAYLTGDELADFQWILGYAVVDMGIQQECLEQHNQITAPDFRWATPKLDGAHLPCTYVPPVPATC